MSGHSAGCSGSRSLCDALFSALGALIPGLKRGASQRWCGFYAPGRRRLAYVSHFKTSDRIEVWCRGGIKALQKAGPPPVKPRNKTDSGGFEDDFPGRFEVTSPSGVAPAVRLLHTVSYPAS
jgi:hypothetical protein